MTAVRDVIIIGGGIGGLTLANALHRRGMKARIIESARREDRLGTGISLLGNSLRALDAIGIADRCLENGYGWETVTVHDSTGTPLNTTTMPRKWRPDRPAALGIMRPVLGNLLEEEAVAAGAHIDFETRAETIEQDETGVTVRLTSGETIRGDILVAADGTYSKTRAAIFGEEHKPRYIGQGAWRYTAPRPEAMTGQEFYRPKDGAAPVGCLPLSETLCYYFFLETTPDSKFRVAEADVCDYLRRKFETYSAPNLVAAAALIDGSSHIGYRPFNILLMPQPWYRGRVVLIGDAAHSLTPQLTAGGGMAIEDAVVLAEELDRHAGVEDALAAYCARRGPRVKSVFEASLAVCEEEMNPSGLPLKALELLKVGHSVLAEPV